MRLQASGFRLEARGRRASPAGRGLTLLEVLVASAVMLIALSGISMMLIYSRNSSSAAMRDHIATELASERMEEYQALTSQGVVGPGVYDAGFTDQNGRVTNCQVVVSDGSSQDGGSSVLTYRIEVEVSYLLPNGKPTSFTVDTLVSRPLGTDAGP
jgi:prepilin-type N-terminal cleavage/methylation domain-containing protein